MYIADPKDRTFFTFLIEQEVISATDLKNWDTPEDVVLMDALSDNAEKIDLNKFVAAGLRSHSSFVHIPNIQPEWEFVKSIPNHQVWELIDEFKIFPLRQVGPFSWMGTCFFHPFRGDKALDLLGWEGTRLIAWNVLTPINYRNLKQIFHEHVPRFV